MNLSLDEEMMALALDLAELGLGSVHPNPPVGAVVARDGVVLSRGWHRRPGAMHAEIVALHDVDARGATLYTTLEPCSTWGRTPPCTRALVRSGVSRVVVACLDVNPANAGRSRAALEAAGVSLTYGVLEARAVALTRDFRELWASSSAR